MVQKIKIGGLLLFSLIFISACGTSIDKQQELALEKTEKAFNAEPIEANKKLQSLVFYLPSAMSIKDDKPNNILLDKEDHPYILFYNPNEKADSKALYNLLIDSTDPIIVNQTFMNGERFGYMVITEIEEDELYEVTAGIGGIKATTESAVKNIADDSEILMEIVRSASVN